MSVGLVLVIVVLLVLASFAIRGGTRRIWDNSGPGQWYSTTPNGSIAPKREEFDAPKNEGDLL